MDEIAPFRVMELLARANELQRLGHDVVHMEVGEPDFPTPGPIIEAAKAGLGNGDTKYTDARGTVKLREAIARHYQDWYGVEVSPHRVFVTAGASGGLLLLAALLMNPGDNLLMTDPGYPCNRHFLSSFNAEGCLVPVGASDNYQLNPELIARYWNDSSRGILIASPANPTGSVLTREDYVSLGETLAPKNGLLIADEIYHGLIYEEGLECTAISSVPDAFIINSFSKYFGMTGWRLGWLIVPDSVTADLEKLAQNLFICPSAVAQVAALSAFSDSSREIMEAQKEEFRARRDFLVPALQELGFLVPSMPVGAFYVYAGLPDGVPDSEDFCRQTLEQQYVAITPGTDFGFNNANRFVRFSYAQDLECLEKAVDRLSCAFSSGEWV